MDAGQIAVSALYHYPVKSCAGTRVERLELLETGPCHDRELLVIDAQTGIFLTQRGLPRLALIAPAIHADRLCATAPGMEHLAADLQRDGNHRPVTIWRDLGRERGSGGARCRMVQPGILGQAVRVVRKAPSFIRHVPRSCLCNPIAHDQVSFADGYPLLILSEESLAGLNRRLAEPLPMARFKPNNVIAGGPLPHHEDSLTCFTIGGIAMSAVKPCARCVQTTVDQQTALVGKEPLRTLATYRKGPRGVLFGMNVIHHGRGWLAVGQQVLRPEHIPMTHGLSSHAHADSSSLL